MQMTYVTPEPYIGHLGLDGVGDTKGLLESEMRAKHIKWMTSTRVKKVEQGKMTVEEVGEDGVAKPEKELPFAFSMMLPAFRGIKPVAGIEGLSNPRGFTIVDRHQQNTTYPEIFAVGVCVAIPPMGPTPVPVGVPKTGFMIESMVTATAHNIANLVRPDDANLMAVLETLDLSPGEVRSRADALLEDLGLIVLNRGDGVVRPRAAEQPALASTL